MENKHIRRAKLKQLIHDYGTLVALGKATGINPALFSQIKNGTRNMGAKTARQIEKHLGKPLGWMDQDNGIPLLAALGTDKMLLQLIDLYAQLGPTQQHELVAHVNKLVASNMTKPTAADPFNGVKIPHRPKATHR